VFSTKIKRRSSAAKPLTSAAGQRKREADAARSRKISVQAREIGPIPAVVDSVRREAARTSLKAFCESYLKPTFPLDWCTDHLRVIEKIERTVLHGGQFCVAMPRAAGKSSLLVSGTLWALLFGHRSYAVMIGSTEQAAEGLLHNLKSALSRNDLIASDFPETAIPIRALENDARRANGQLSQGTKTNISWTNKRVVFPTVAGSKTSGAVVSACGLTGRIRGLNHPLPSGQILRPDLTLIDDPQSTESAWSDSQVEHREALLHGDVLNLAGPGKKIAALAAVTVIRSGDLADRLLDRKNRPEWSGERFKMVYSWPTDSKLWEQYCSIRSESLQRDGDGSEATDFYREHRTEMDAGAEVAWPARFNAAEISGLQHAVNLKMRDEAAFAAEYQNEPKVATQDQAALRPEEITAKCNGLARGICPLETVAVTAFADVHDSLIYFAVIAWHQDGTGAIVDYGTYPEQPRRYFQMREATNTLQKLSPAAGKEGAILAGLNAVINDLFGRTFKRSDGAEIHISRMLVDLGYVPSTAEQAIRMSNKGAAIIGSRGVGITAAGKPMSEYLRKPGEIIGREWMLTKSASSESRSVRFDSNYWKSWVSDRLATAMGDKTSLTLYGIKPNDHRLIADHLTAETATPTEGRGRKLREWRPKPARPDNHWLDCIVGCAVAASMVGVGNPVMPRRKPIRRSNREAQYF
jgi:hypothetical protein